MAINANGSPNSGFTLRPNGEGSVGFSGNDAFDQDPYDAAGAPVTGGRTEFSGGCNKGSNTGIGGFATGNVRTQAEEDAKGDFGTPTGDEIQTASIIGQSDTSRTNADVGQSTYDEDSGGVGAPGRSNIIFCDYQGLRVDDTPNFGDLLTHKVAAAQVADQATDGASVNVSGITVEAGELFHGAFPGTEPAEMTSSNQYP